MTIPRLFKNRDVATLAGAVLIAAGLVCLRDASEKRGLAPPWWRGMFTPL